MKRAAWAFAAGAIFGTGLILAEATNPSVVLAFLDVTGAWDARLLFMFAGAVASYALFLRLLRRRQRPLFEPAFDMPLRGAIDARLVAGAAVFGVGWGLAGICPGPAFTSLLSGAPEPVLFTVSMLAGMLLYERATATSWRRAPARAPDPS